MRARPFQFHSLAPVVPVQFGAHHPPVFERHWPVGKATDAGIVRDDDQRVPLGMQPPENIQHNFLVGRVKVAGRLISQNNLGLVDERTGNAHPLLLAAGELRGQMIEPLAQPHPVQRGARQQVAGPFG